MSLKTVLYEDKSVRITPDQLEIFEYYFPLPMNKTINMCDVKEVNLKTDVNKHQEYLEIVVKGFSMNATFSPLDPKKCLDIIRTHSCFDLAGKNISQATTTTTPLTGTTVYTETKPTTDVKAKVYSTTEDIKQGARQMKQQGQRKWEGGKQAVKQETEPGIIENVSATISQGWQEVKEVSQNLYDATTQKLHEMTAPETEQKARQAKEDFKQGAKNVKEGAKDVKRDVESKAKEGSYEAKKATGMQPQKSLYQNIKEGASDTWENVKEGTSIVYNKTAQKVSEVVGTDAESKAQQAKQDFKSGAKETKQSMQKATGTQKTYTQQAKEKLQEATGTDAKGKAKSAKEHFKQGTQDLGESAKKATGYEGSALQEAKENVAEGLENTKKSAQSAYDSASKKLGEMGSSAQQTIGQKTKQTGQALKEKGNEMQKNA